MKFQLPTFETERLHLRQLTSNDLDLARGQAVFEHYISGLVGSPSTIDLATAGRYVRVQMENSGYLVLGEVEVMGCVADNSNNGNSQIFKV